MMSKKVKKIFYFGYGPNRRKEIIGAITANDNLVGYRAYLRGHILCTQKLHHISDCVFPSSPLPLSPRKILQSAWKDNFKSYTIIKGKKSDEIDGTIWELTPQEFDLVREWELTDFGWSKEIKAKAITKEGQVIDVVTEGVRGRQKIDRVFNGKKYKSFPVPLQYLMWAILKCRREYFERISVNALDARGGPENIVD
jgi:hypothetical protein